MNTSTNNKNKISALFKSGAHFGFTKRRRHPSVISYLFGTKDGNDVIDLEKTAAQLEQAMTVVADYAKQGKTILFVGTKDEIKNLVEQAAVKADSPYVVNRWIGGMLTNYSEIRKRIQRLTDLENELSSGALERKYTKKELVVLKREMDKLRFNFGGMQTISKLPDLMVVIDVRHEGIAIDEATQLQIPVVGVMGTDSDVNQATYPVVMNDGLTESVSLVLEEIVTAVKTGASEYVPPKITPRTGRTYR